MSMNELIEKIHAANAAYAAGIPFLTDSEYDILWQQLFKLDPDNENLYHTARNSSIITGAITHRHPIYGTNKAFNTDDLRIFLTRFGSAPLVIEPKYDGCAAVLERTQDGWQLALEGDGLSGGDITHLIPHINFPFTHRYFQAVEIVIPLADWDPSYGKNPRNTVSGWTNPLRKAAPPAKMTAVPHNFGMFSLDYNYDGDMDALNTLLLRTHTAWKEIYPIDGLMIKVKDENARLIAGTNGTRNNWSIAWKPPIQTAETTVTDIEWNVSRLGRIIPTVIYDPIELCGTTNSRVTGNNAQWMVDRDIKIGSTLLVGKAGEIIPKIIKVVDSVGISCSDLPADVPDNGVDVNPNTGLPVTGISVPETKQSPLNKEFDLLTTCPICNNTLTWEGVHLICKAPNCIARLITSVTYFYSDKGMAIKGIGEATIEKILLTPEGYLALSEFPWALLDPYEYNLTGILHAVLGQKTYFNLCTEIDKINGTKSMAHFIAGLGLPGLAYKTSLRLCQFLKTGKLNIPVSEKARQNFILAVEKYNGASNNMKQFKFGKVPNSAKAIYCITGTLSISREAMIEKVSPMGYEFSNGVTRETNYLIIGDEPGKTKTNKATRYNIPMINEHQFNVLITGG